MKFWSEDEIQFLRANLHRTYKEIANMLNRTPLAVRFQFRKHKIKKIKAPHTKYQANEEFFHQWTDDMSYILGFTFADGSIRTRRGNSSRLRLCNSDWDLLDKIRLSMNSNHRITIDKRTGTDFYLDITRFKIVEHLEILGLTENNSRTMEFPQIPEKYFFSFVRGYFDGDGHIKLRGKSGRGLRLVFASGSKEFLTTLKVKLEERGRKCSLRTLNKGKPKESYQVSILKKGRKLFYQSLYGNDSPNFTGIKMEIKYKAFITYFEKNIKIQCLDCGITIEKTAPNHVRCAKCAHERDKRMKREARKAFKQLNGE